MKSIIYIPNPVNHQIGAPGLSKFIYLRGAVTEDEREEEMESKKGGKSMTVLAETALIDVPENVIQIIFSDLYSSMDWSATLDFSSYDLTNVREISFYQNTLRKCHNLIISSMKGMNE